MNDPQLSNLLHRWRDIEPRANFEQNVHRRIRQAAPEPVRPVTWLWPVTAATLVALVIGGWTGLHTRTEATGFLASDTLTGRYMELAHR
jgi:hypothetical protein